MTDEWGPRKGPAKLPPSSTVKRRVWIDVADGSVVVAADLGRGVAVRTDGGAYHVRPGEVIQGVLGASVTGPRGRSWCSVWGGDMSRSLGCPTRQMRPSPRLSVDGIGFSILAQEYAQAVRRQAFSEGHGPGQPLGSDSILNPRPLARLEARTESIRAGMARGDR